MPLLKRLPARLYRLLVIAIFFMSYMGTFSCRFAVANARAIGELNASISSDKVEDQTAPKGSETHLRVNVATGWLFELSDVDALGGGISFRAGRGLVFDGQGDDVTGYGVGLFAAWYRGAFSIRADYIALAELKSNNGIAETAFRDGRGFALQARWMFWLQTEPRLGIGPSLGLERMEYVRSRVGTLPETSASRTVTAPIVGMTSLFYF